MAKVLDDAAVGWGASAKKKTLSDADVGWTTPDALDQSAKELTSPWGAIKDVGLGALKNLGKATVSAVDMLAGVPGQAVGVGADIGARLYGAATGESPRNISEAGRIASEQTPGMVGLSKAPFTDTLKRLGVEEYDQSGVANALTKFSESVAKRTGGLLDQNDIMSLFDTAMMAGGAHGVDAGVKAALTKPKATGVANRGTYVETLGETPAPQTPLAEQLNARMGILSPEEVAARTKAQGKNVATAFKDAETADALAAQAEGQQAIWAGPDHDLPVEVTGAPQRGPDGKLYTPVRYNGQASYAPSAELRFTVRTEPTGEAIGASGEFERSGAAGPVQPKSRSGETPIVGEPQPALNSALQKVRDGRTFDLTAEERIALRGFKNAPDQIQKGAIDPELLNWLAAGGVAATIGGVELTRYLRQKESEDKVPPPMREPLRGPDGEVLAGAGLASMAVLGAMKGKFANTHEAVLVDAAKGGDSQAFAEIYRREAPRLERVASRYVQDQSQAKDLVQEAMLSAYKALPDFKGDSKLSTWLHKIVVNKALNKIDSDTRQIVGEEISPETEGRIASESPTPQQELQTKQLRGALQAGLNRLVPEMREAFQLRELEGMDYEAIAAEQGVPVGTVRSRIARAKEALQGYLKEYGGKALGVGGVAGATALIKPEDTAENVGLAAAILAMKGKGGMWHPEAVKRLATPLVEKLTNQFSHRDVQAIAQAAERGVNFKEGTDAAKIVATSQFVNRAVRNYLNKHAGTATDPLKDVEVPYGEGTKRWEELTDELIKGTKAKSIQPESDGRAQWRTHYHPEAKGIPPEETIWNIEKPGGWSPDTQIRADHAIQSYLSHVGDYLREHVSLEKLGQYDLVRAVKETAQWDKELAKKMDKARLAEKEVSPIYKQYDDGMYWQQLTKPGQFARESDAMGHSVRGYEPHGGIASGAFGKGEPAHPDWIEASGDSGHPGYGLGGWEAIKSGDAKVYSLRDAKGQSHATIEVAAKGSRPTIEEMFDPGVDAHSRSVADEITQIKGKQNRAPQEKYLPYVQDFVKSGKWGEVGDLENTGLIETDNGYILRKELSEKYGIPENQLGRELMRQTGAVVRNNMRRNGNPAGNPPTLEMEPEGFRNQRGSVDPKLLVGLGAIVGGGALGVTFANLLDPQHPIRDGIYGALVGAALGTGAGRTAIKNVIASPDKALGLISTRLGNIAPELKFKLRNHELRVLKETDAANDAALPFIEAIQKLPADAQARVNRALLNGDTSVIQSIPALAQTYPAVKKLLGSIESQLQGLGRFGEGVSNYFPRLVKDFEGLRTAIGKDASQGLEKHLIEEEAKMIKKEGRSLTEVEQSLIANRYLFSEDQTSFQPGFAKSRKFRDVPENLQQFYAPPTESLLRYISGAVNDLEIARFFGKDLASKKSGKKLFNDVDGSIGNLTARLMREGKISQPQAMELRDMLKARFEGGEQGMSSGLAGIRNITNTALLGNIASAATQIGDSLMTIYHHGLVPTLQATAQTIIGKQQITPKQLGLINHVAEELSEMGATGRALHVAMKYSGFHAIDMFAKGLGLNAAIIKNAKLVATPAGEAKFRAKYQPAFGDDIGRVIEDLKQKRSSDLIDQLAFTELSDTQPVSKAEMPEMYLKHPNGRLLYQLKTYMLKQADIVRRDAYQEIAKGTPQGIMTGAKNLAALATVYAVSNVPGDAVKDFIAGRDIDPLSTPRLVENVFQTFGINRYAGQQLGQGKVVETGLGMMTPPLRVMQDIAKLNEKSVSYVPFIGRPVYDRFLGGNEKREIYETRMENKGKAKADRKLLSPAAKEYLRKQREEKKARQ